MKYPAIIRNDNEVEMLLLNKGSAIILSDTHKGEVHDVFPRFRRRYVDITHEYLSNTWGVVESKEHAEFIIELAELHGFGVWNSHKIDCGESVKMFFFCPVDNALQLYHNDISQSMINGEKQITIPLPPKAKEWKPEVGDTVTWGNKVCNGVVKAVDGNLAWIKNDHANYVTEYIDNLVKPKSKQDLLIEELQTKLCNNNAVDNYILACDIINGEIEGLSYEV